MHTERRNHTSTQEKMIEHTFILKKQKKEETFESMIEKHFLEEEMFNSLVEERITSHFEERFLEEEKINSLVEEHFQKEEMFNSLIEEYLLKEDVQDSLIEEYALDAERLNSLEESISEYVDFYDAIEGFEEDDDCYDSDYDDYSNVDGWCYDPVLFNQQSEEEDYDDSSCCFEIGYYNDENSPGIFGSYVGIYNPEY